MQLCPFHEAKCSEGITWSGLRVAEYLMWNELISAPAVGHRVVQQSASCIKLNSENQTRVNANSVLETKPKTRAVGQPENTLKVTVV